MTDPVTHRPKPLRRLTGMLAAAAVALAVQAPAPAPAASNEDLARLLAGVAGAAILFGILESGKRTQAAPRSTPPPLHARPGHRPPPVQHHRPHRPAALPAQCAVQVAGRGGTRTYYGQRCLQRAGIDLRQLPRSCAVDLRGPRQSGRAYDAACLRQAGFRTPRR